jgi:hypothetical protein
MKVFVERARLSGSSCKSRARFFPATWVVEQAEVEAAELTPIRLGRRHLARQTFSPNDKLSHSPGKTLPNQALPGGKDALCHERFVAFAAFIASRIFAPYFCTRHSPSPRTFRRSSKPRAGMRTISSSHLFCATM